MVGNVSDPKNEPVVMMRSGQVGKTEFESISIEYFVPQDSSAKVDLTPKLLTVLLTPVMQR